MFSFRYVPCLFFLLPLFSSACSSGSSSPYYLYHTNDTATSTDPMLVVLDTNQTMSIDAGKGVGIYVEYKENGLWTISWTCDTFQTGRNCNYYIRVNGHAIEEPVSFGNVGTVAVVEDQLTISVVSDYDVSGISFYAEPGATLLVEGRLSGEGNTSYFQFVQDGQINGGYQGALTNPLYFQPSSP